MYKVIHDGIIVLKTFQCLSKNFSLSLCQQLFVVLFYSYICSCENYNLTGIFNILRLFYCISVHITVLKQITQNTQNFKQDFASCH